MYRAGEASRPNKSCPQMTARSYIVDDRGRRFMPDLIAAAFTLAGSDGVRLI